METCTLPSGLLLLKYSGESISFRQASCPHHFCIKQLLATVLAGVGRVWWVFLPVLSCLPDKWNVVRSRQVIYPFSTWEFSSQGQYSERWLHPNKALKRWNKGFKIYLYSGRSVQHIYLIIQILLMWIFTISSILGHERTQGVLGTNSIVED